MLHGLCILAAPVILWCFFSFEISTLLLAGNSVGSLMLATYLGVCAVVGLFVLPLVSIMRIYRPIPGVLAGNRTRTIDVATRLGYKPVGRGKYRHVARLPWNEVFQVDFGERTLCLPRLPKALDGMSILHLSDLHLCGTPDRKFHQEVMDLCNAWEPDLVAVTGDIVDSWHHHRWIMPILGRLRYKSAAFAILGNHDSWHDPALVRRRLRRINMVVLENTWTQLTVRGETLVVIGHEGPWFRPAPDLRACPAGVFRLCLSHTPDNIRWAREANIDLMLSGHVHGGQVRFPFFGSVFVPSGFGRRYDCGTFDEPPTVLHVSRGLGGQQPLRFNCRPEVTKIVLRQT